RRQGRRQGGPPRRQARQPPRPYRVGVQRLRAVRRAGGVLPHRRRFEEVAPLRVRRCPRGRRRPGEQERVPLRPVQGAAERARADRARRRRQGGGKQGGRPAADQGGRRERGLRRQETAGILDRPPGRAAQGRSGVERRAGGGGQDRAVRVSTLRRPLVWLV